LRSNLKFIIWMRLSLVMPNLGEAQASFSLYVSSPMVCTTIVNSVPYDLIYNNFKYFNNSFICKIPNFKMKCEKFRCFYELSHFISYFCCKYDRRYLHFLFITFNDTQLNIGTICKAEVIRLIIKNKLLCYIHLKHSAYFLMKKSH